VIASCNAFRFRAATSDRCQGAWLVAIAERSVAAAVEARAHSPATAPGRAPLLASGVAAHAVRDRGFLELNPLLVAEIQGVSRSMRIHFHCEAISMQRMLMPRSL